MGVQGRLAARMRSMVPVLTCALAASIEPGRHHGEHPHHGCRGRYGQDVLASAARAAEAECLWVCHNESIALCIPPSQSDKPAAVATMQGEVWEGVFKEHVTNFVAPRVMQGTVAALAGLFFGDWLPVLEAAVGPQGAVYGFEPTPSVKQSRATAGANGLRVTHITNAALSDTPGSVQMCVADEKNQPLGGMSRIVHGKHKGSGGAEEEIITVRNHESECGESITVPCVTLDMALPWREREVSFLLLDVEGHEEAALAGAMKMIAKWHPVLAIEQRIKYLGDVFKQLMALGYRPCDDAPFRHDALFFYCSKNSKHAAALSTTEPKGLATGSAAAVAGMIK